MKTPYKPSLLAAGLLAAATFGCATPENSQPNLAHEESPLLAAEQESQAFLPFSWTSGTREDLFSGKQVVRVLMAPGWGTASLAVARIKEVAIARGVTIEVVVEEVSPMAPAPLGYKGSPTIIIHGVDLEPSVRGEPDSGHGWRTYSDASPDNAGVPSNKMIVQGLRDAGWLQ